LPAVSCLPIPCLSIPCLSIPCLSIPPPPHHSTQVSIYIYCIK
jgi:hypothetical protein